MKKIDKKDIIDVNISDEEGIWHDKKVYYLIAIRGKMDEEFVKTTKEQN